MPEKTSPDLSKTESGGSMATTSTGTTKVEPTIPMPAGPSNIPEYSKHQAQELVASPGASTGDEAEEFSDNSPVDMDLQQETVRYPARDDDDAPRDEPSREQNPNTPNLPWRQRLAQYMTYISCWDIRFGRTCRLFFAGIISAIVVFNASAIPLEMESHKIFLVDTLLVATMMIGTLACIFCGTVNDNLRAM